jgi:hypothetical protein
VEREILSFGDSSIFLFGDAKLLVSAKLLGGLRRNFPGVIDFVITYIRNDENYIDFQSDSPPCPSKGYKGPVHASIPVHALEDLVNRSN